MKKKTKKSTVKPQKNPTKNKNVAIWDLIIKEIKERDADGVKKYGTRLQAFNGRDSSVDAWQECMDLLVYFRQLIEEKKEIVSFLKRAMIAPGLTINELEDLGLDAEDLLSRLGELN